ncbi:MAG: hypothetical protein D6704_04595 [Nitrospirae bacterium]|nr:MAG: hypothetical protein D6704_04595 [Nitrospirota bacterium]
MMKRSCLSLLRLSWSPNLAHWAGNTWYGWLIILSLGLWFGNIPLGIGAEPQESPSSVSSGMTWTVASDGSGQFQSIQEAVNYAQAGDTIVVKAGRYPEDITIHGKERLKIIGEGMDRVIVVGQRRVGTLHIGKWPYGVTRIEIHGMTIQQHGGLGLGIFNGGNIVLKQVRVQGMLFAQQVQHVRLESCVIGESETTGVAFADSTATVIGSFVHDNDHGVSIAGRSRVVLERNVVTRNLFEAVLVSDRAHAVLRQNTLVNNGGGVSFQEGTTGELYGNIIGNTQVGIKIASNVKVIGAYNAVFDNVRDYHIASSAPESGMLHTMVHRFPRFVDPQHGDYRLKPDSPLIGVGDYAYLGALPPIEE